MEITLPHDADVEALLLSSAMNSQTSAGYVLTETDMEDYYFPRHRLLFSICKMLYEKNSPLDVHLIFSEIKDQGKTHELSRDNLLNMSQLVASSIDCEEFGKKLKNLSTLRKIIYGAKTTLMDASKSGADCDDVINDLQEKLLQAKGIEKKGVYKIKELIDNFSRGMSFNDHHEWMINQRRLGYPPYEGISSGFPILDETLGYFRNSCIYYIGARTSMGKTTFLLNLINNMKESSIGFFSLEMPAETIAAKLFCIGADIKYSHYEDAILYPEKVARLHEMSKQFKNREIYIEDPSTITISQLRARAKRMKSTYGIQILFVDYLTRIRGGKHANKHLEVDEVSKGLQSLAKELQIPVICLAQLNRKAAQEGEGKVKEPSIMDFRESGSIEEDADACILLHRPDYYNSSTSAGVIKVIVAKNRLRGILKTIDFSCNKLESDRYHEQKSIEQELRDAQDKDCDEIARQICGR